MLAIMNFCIACANWFWGLPILILIVGGGLYMSLRLGFPQITKLRYICSQTFGKMFVKAEAGKISPFAATCSALGSSIGASNIVGVPVAIALDRKSTRLNSSHRCKARKSRMPSSA